MGVGMGAGVLWNLHGRGAGLARCGVAWNSEGVVRGALTALCALARGFGKWRRARWPELVEEVLA